MAAVWLWAPSVAFVFCLAIWWLWQRAWRRFLSAIMFPLVTLAAFLNYDALWRAIREGGDMIHLWAMVPTSPRDSEASGRSWAAVKVFRLGGFRFDQLRRTL
jgi:apolipoprotein N-acyltransferase